jgi:hypothetical protein
MESKTVRLVIVAEEEVRQALKLEAARQGVDMSPLAEKILRAGLADAIREIREREKKKSK